MSVAADRARRMLARPGAWIDQQADRYPVRVGGDRRSRISLTLDEADFRALVADPGLCARPGGGWTARPEPRDAGPAPGRPGLVIGETMVMEDDGRLTTRAANLGENPIAWLARRRDPSGRPWLTPAEVAAGERLRRDGELAASGPSLTMRWDALPRSGGGSAARVEPGDQAISAAARVEAALQAVSPRVRAFVIHVCLRSSSLQLAERELGLRRRQGKTMLKQGLEALAEHYGIG
ncbi:DUF6456 domain-containing protein [Brevundimonas goettingensis]|uniref:DUF6456 domain-containing protein n=1 Tax=Brevundimonas goettingensis TaxID=2774190 RepID=A0A975C142_9CAUL|nr:DUF6456 domain-containing protein [Brevundimonas goettingensis]QTC91565.1 hypothetical protein IFJ75_01095 [Brevundimonas goettingensis]